VVQIPDGRRDEVAAALHERGVETAVYYPTPLHLQPALADFKGRRGDYPEAERGADEVLALPIHPTLPDTDIVRVTEALSAACLTH
jgi:dTDP-4-amino-4,6-dideoxygalactose transaminase